MESYFKREKEGMFNDSNRRNRAFVTFVANEKREIVQLSFDKSVFSRKHTADVSTKDNFGLDWCQNLCYSKV